MQSQKWSKLKDKRIKSMSFFYIYIYKIIKENNFFQFFSTATYNIYLFFIKSNLIYHLTKIHRFEVVSFIWVHCTFQSRGILKIIDCLIVSSWSIDYFQQSHCKNKIFPFSAMFSVVTAFSSYLPFIPCECIEFVQR